MRPVIYSPRPTASRIKLYIPYQEVEIRSQIKQVNTSYYHPQQKMWSVVNTSEKMEEIKQILHPNYEVKVEERSQTVKPSTLSEKSFEIMAGYERKLILKAYSRSTIITYKSEFTGFLRFFENRDLKDVTKKEVEGYLAHLITKFKIS